MDQTKSGGGAQATTYAHTLSDGCGEIEDDVEVEVVVDGVRDGGHGKQDGLLGVPVRTHPDSKQRGWGRVTAR